MVYLVGLTPNFRGILFVGDVEKRPLLLHCTQLNQPFQCNLGHVKALSSGKLLGFLASYIFKSQHLLK